MPPNPSKVVFPNPFYVLLVVVSSIFLITVLAYLIGPYIQQQKLDQPNAGPSPLSTIMTSWLERHGPLALAAEFGVMLVAALLAMGFDHKFPQK